MKSKYEFSQLVPSWTKLGSAELFRLLEHPAPGETAVKERAIYLGIKWDKSVPYIESESEGSINDFLAFVANWYTQNKLTMISNYDILLKKDDNGVIVPVPSPRPATVRHMPSNSSNIKPTGIKEIEKSNVLPDPLEKIIEKIRNEGFGNIPAEKFKNSRIYNQARYVEFKVVPTSGRKGKCFACSRVDYLTETKETQFPLTVGLENYANFYSYHSGKVGFCRTCAVSNHLAFGRVLYNVSGNLIFYAIPQATSIEELMKFLEIIDSSYPVVAFIRSMKTHKGDVPIFITKVAGGWSNFVEKEYGNSGFYFLILTLFVALSNTITTIVSDIKDERVKEDLLRSQESDELTKLLYPEGISQEMVDEAISRFAVRSWEFILSDGDQHLRYWRYPNSRQILNLLEEIKTECRGLNPLPTVKKLIYKSGNNYIDTRREDFSRSLLLGMPETGVLEEVAWEKMSRDETIKKEISDLATFLTRKKIGGSKMEKDEVLKQLRTIGWTIANLSDKDNSKSLLYELRSVGNPQAFRSFIERFTFICALKGEQTSISNDFLKKLYDGDEWREYKSLIAIVANQTYSYLKSDKTPEKTKQGVQAI